MQQSQNIIGLRRWSRKDGKAAVLSLPASAFQIVAKYTDTLQAV
jgi:hypothetical protein